jgi:phospho-N-acetylmuramoyl-pentapeptide-transferase
MIAINIIKVILPAVISFIVGMAITPVVTNFLYKNKMWKKKAKTVAIDGGGTPIFNSLHAVKEISTPRMGGIVIWMSVLITTVGLWLIARIFPTDLTTKLDFLSRNQTWIPLFTLIFGAIVGLIDDLLDIRGNGGGYAGGLSLRKRLALVGIISFLISIWFYFKLDINTINFPLISGISLGLWFIPIFIAIVLLIYSGGIIDGIDGLSGGVFASAFAAYAGIAYFQQQINLAAFCVVVVGGILAFLWFNIPPARFYMSETGSMALTITLAIVAFMTDSMGGGRGVAVLPIIALPLIITTISVVLQLLSKKFRGKKIFLVSPVHHHFEAVGWPGYKVSMRYWIVSIVCAVFGLILALI